MSDYAVEESVCLLKRAHWFEAYLKVLHPWPACVHDECSWLYALFDLDFAPAEHARTSCCHCKRLLCVSDWCHWQLPVSPLRWVVHVQEVEKGKGRVAPVPEHFGAATFTADDAREWQDWQEYSQDYSRYEYEIDEDDEVSTTSSKGRNTSV